MKRRALLFLLAAAAGLASVARPALANRVHAETKVYKNGIRRDHCDKTSSDANRDYAICYSSFDAAWAYAKEGWMFSGNQYILDNYCGSYRPSNKYNTDTHAHHHPGSPTGPGVPDEPPPPIPPPGSPGTIAFSHITYTPISPTQLALDLVPETFLQISTDGLLPGESDSTSLLLEVDGSISRVVLTASFTSGVVDVHASATGLFASVPYSIQPYPTQVYALTFNGPLHFTVNATLSSSLDIEAGDSEPAPVPCTVADNGTGTVDLPPVGCGYVSPDSLHRIIDGLPAGTTIKVAAEHQGFFVTQRDTGGSLGGEVEKFQSDLVLTLTGTGDLATFQRVITLPTQCESHTAPHGSGPIQSFDTNMFRIEGQLPLSGDPDFLALHIVAGTGFGLPSPGHTTLIQNSGPFSGPGTWSVYSFFDITYRIDFIGRPGGALSGRSGSTTATIRMLTGAAPTTDVPGDLQHLGTRLQLSNRPNPLSSGTTFEYRLESPALVQLSVYDAAGHRVRRLTNQRMPAGPHAVYWNSRDDAGRRLSPGTYFAKLVAGGQATGSTKVTIIK